MTAYFSNGEFSLAPSIMKESRGSRVHTGRAGGDVAGEEVAGEVTAGGGVTGGGAAQARQARRGAQKKDDCAIM